MSDLRPLSVALLGTLLFVGACKEEGKPERGLKYMPDMYDSPALESQDAYVVERTDENGTVTARYEIPVMQTPVPGTASRDFIAYVGTEDNEAAKDLINPLDPTVEVLRRGREQYDIYCAVCHGKDGNMANGYVASKLQGVLSINTENVAGMADGQVYHIITNGRNRMPSYAAQLLPEDRWAVVHYVRTLYKAGTVKGDELKRLQQVPTYDDRFEKESEPVPEYQRETWPSKTQEDGK